MMMIPKMAAESMVTDVDFEKMPDLEVVSDDEVDQGDDWDDWVEDGSQCKCLFCDEMFGSILNHFKHCYSKHEFNIASFSRENNLDTYGYIKLVNYMRTTKPTDISKIDLSGRTWLSDDYLLPVDAKDPLLQFDIEDDEEINLIEKEMSGSEEKIDCEDKNINYWRSKVKCLENKVCDSDNALSRAIEDLGKMKLIAKELIVSSNETQDANTVKGISAEEDESYFNSYSHFGIHAEMLQDTVRTESYRDFIYNNKQLFDGKIVLDVGCGTGILSMFAAKAGAKKVIAVDQSDVIYQAMDIVKDNKLDHVITLVKGKIEEIRLPVDSVDIIISEWMGYFLLFESMLDTVLYARDKWLAPGGCIFPDGCSIFLTATADPELFQRNLGFWDDVYGFKMSCMKSTVIKETSVQILRKDFIVADPVTIKEIDINSCQIKDLDFKSSFSLTINTDSVITALVSYFDVLFKTGADRPVEFSTGPLTTPTHWKQTVLLLEKPLSVKKGEILDGKIVCKKNPKDPRGLQISLTICDVTQHYEMN